MTGLAQACAPVTRSTSAPPLPPWVLLPGLVGVVALVDAGGTDDGPGLCVIRRCTGGYCPGCGVTRAGRHLLRGEWAAAWRDHPWLVLVAAQAALALLVAIVLVGWRGLRRATTGSGRGADRSVVGRSMMGHPSRPALLVSVAAINVVLSFGIWIVRLTNGSIPAPF